MSKQLTVARRDQLRRYVEHQVHAAQQNLRASMTRVPPEVTDDEVRVCLDSDYDTVKRYMTKGEMKSMVLRQELWKGKVELPEIPEAPVNMDELIHLKESSNSRMILCQTEEDAVAIIDAASAVTLELSIWYSKVQALSGRRIY